MIAPQEDGKTQWNRRYALMLLVNLILIIAFALIGHYFNK
jgi:hypothetical protein